MNLDGLKFSPLSNSKNGRVDGSCVFIFEQSGLNFTAKYSGSNVSDGHIIGRMTSETTADIIYHSRTKGGHLEAGEASVKFYTLNDSLIMTMNWQWLNGDMTSGESRYGQIL